MLMILLRKNGYVACVKPRGVSSENGTPACPGMPELVARALQVPAEQVLTVHRLDRETGGVMLYALNRAAAAALSALIAEGKLRKEYLAVTEGVPPEPDGQWEDLLFWDRTKRKSYPVRQERRGVKEASLRYTTLEARENRALLRVEPLTGRTHQIRVQCASRGLPLWGDRKYGGKEKEGFGLWCQSLSFEDGTDGSWVRVAADPPDEQPWTGFDLSPER